MSKTDGKWWDVSWNPVSGCTPISEGCANCWARNMANRLRGRAGYSLVKPFAITLHPDKLDLPRCWQKPRRIFVCDMGDLFHESIGPKTIESLLNDCAISDHTFIFLTKRADRMAEIYCEMDDRDGFYGHPNLWFGSTCENQKWADVRISELIQMRCAIRFLCLEPLLGPIDLDYHTDLGECDSDGNWLEQIDWVIIGCESGPKRRSCKLEWIKSIVEQCQAASVPVWVKQIEIAGKVSHDMNDWPVWARQREWPR